jgi:hypothetical protein
MSSDAQQRLDAKVLAQFATEIRRLAAVGHKSMKKGDDLAALSSFSAIAPLVKSLTQELFNAVIENSDETCDETDCGVESKASSIGYL